MISLLTPQLEAFIAVVEQRTVHAAATTLHITQTAVTQRIRTLESKLGTTLFLRTRRRMSLTTEGEILLRYCLSIRELQGKTVSSIIGAGVNTPIRLCISGPTSIMHSRVIPHCFQVILSFPSLLFQFDVNDTDQVKKSLQTGVSQLAILQQEDISTSFALS